MNTKVNQSAKRRMNALLNIALIQSGQFRPETSQIWKVTSTQAHFYFVSSEGSAVGVEDKDLIVDLTDSNESIIEELNSAISQANGESEHYFRKQVRDSVAVASKAYPTQLRSILNTAFSFA